jgi:hypothetical protein
MDEVLGIPNLRSGETPGGGPTSGGRCGCSSTHAALEATRDASCRRSPGLPPTFLDRKSPRSWQLTAGTSYYRQPNRGSARGFQDKDLQDTTPGRPSQVENLGWNKAKPAGSPSRKASSASNPASRWGQACRRITRGRRNRSSALGKLFVQVGLRVRILLPPAERWYGAGGEGDGTIVAGK